MSKLNPILWAARTQDEALFLHKGVIGLTRGETGDLSGLSDSREAFRERVDAAYPEEAAAGRANAAALLYRLVREVQTGDYVAFCHGATVHLGVIDGEYRFDPDVAACTHVRPVKWMKDFPRETFSREALREMASSPVSLFQVKRYTDEFFTALGVPFLATTVQRPAAKKAVSVPAADAGTTAESKPAAPATPVRTASNAPVAAAIPVSVSTEPAVAEAAVRTAVTAAVSAAVSAAGTAAPAVRAAKAAAAAGSPALEMTTTFILGKWVEMAENGTLTDFTGALLQGIGYHTEPDGDGLTAYRDELTPPIRVTASGSGLRIVRPEGERTISGTELAELILKHYAELDESHQNNIPLRLAYVPAEGDDERRTEVRRS